MRIGIDARFLTHPQAGGFKTYTEGLVSALAELETSHEFVLYTDRPAGGSPLPARGNITVRVVRGALPAFGMAWREQIGLVRAAKDDRLDVLHAPSLTAPLGLGCPSVVTIHDMLWLVPPAQASRLSGKRRLMRAYYRLVPRLAARRAAAVLTVSEASRRSIVERLGIPSERIVVTYEAAKPSFSCVDRGEAAARVRQKYGLSSSFVLALGSADPRKNLPALLEAYARLPQPLMRRHVLGIVWTHRYLAQELTERAARLGIADRVHYLENVADDDLAQLYNAAEVFVFPSLQEGFGLPAVEAMACGTPVIASDNSSLPEVVGDAGVLVDAREPAAIADALERLLNDEAQRSALGRKGIERAAMFSWRRCAEETMTVYERAAAS